MPSRRQRIIEAMEARLQVIYVRDGFNTDAGDRLFVGEVPQLGESDPDEAIALVIGDDDPTIAGPGFLIGLPLEVHALCKVTVEDPWTRIESLIEDIKRAVELEDRRFDGLLTSHLERGATQTRPRESESLTAGVVIPYRAQYKEAWGAP
jgi:hypothetical protein